MSNKIIIKVLIFIFILIGIAKHEKIETMILAIDKNIGLIQSAPILMFVSEPYGDKNILLSWSIPNTKLYSHTELICSDILKNNYYENEVKSVEGRSMIALNNHQSYVLLDKEKINEKYCSAFAVDRFGRFSKPKTIYVQANMNSNTLLKLFEYTYFDNKIKYIYHTLENKNLKVLFSRGVIIGVENKKSNNIIVDTNFNFLNSYLTPMDIYGDKIIFSLYRSVYEDSFSWIEIKKDINSISFTRHYIDESRVKVISYSLNNKTIKIDYSDDFLDSRSAIRINFLGDDNYKAITKWEAENVSSVIDEVDYDKTNLTVINTQYQIENKLDYKHKEKIFNDKFPYTESRKFLKITKDTKFNLYHDKTKIFTMYGATDRFFFYKNCSGEEGFMFGYKFPYMNGKKTIENNFSIYLKVEY